jgi:hypothetical protein
MKAQALRSEPGVGDAWARVQSVVAGACESAAERSRAGLGLWESAETRTRLEGQLLRAEYILRLRIKSAEEAADAQR